MALRLRRNNPYSTGFILRLPNNTLSLDRKKLVHKPSPTDKIHVVHENESLDRISLIYYGNSKYWWVIADINQIENPLDITQYIGQVLIIPDILLYQ